MSEVLTIRLNGGEMHNIREYAKEKAWGVSDVQLTRYINEADKMLGESLERDKEKLITRHLAQRRDLYARAIQDGDVRTALAILRDEGELVGLYAPPKTKDDGSTTTTRIVTIVEVVLTPALEHTNGNGDLVREGEGDQDRGQGTLALPCRTDEGVAE